MKKKTKTLRALVMSASILSAILVISISFNWQGSSIHIARIAKALYGQSSSLKTQMSGTTTTAARATSSNTIQLSVKEESEDVYRWVSSSDGAINPTLKVSANSENIIKIQNPTDTKHKLVIDTTNSHPSSGDIDPNSSGQLSFKPTMAGTITYHCAYHPQTMKGTIQVESGS
jgi:plastocyanin